MDQPVQPDIAVQDSPVDLDSAAQDIPGQIGDATRKWFQKSGTDSANE